MIFAVGIFLAGAKNSSAFVPLNPPLDLSGLKNIIKWKAQCNTFKGKIDSKINKFNSIHDDHIYKFNLLKYKLETLISKLDNAGYDTAKLREDVDTLEVKIDELNNLHKTLIEFLQEAKGIDCETKWGSPKYFLADIRGVMKSNKDKSKEIKDFYKDEIRDHIEDLKNQTPSN